MSFLSSKNLPAVIFGGGCTGISLQLLEYYYNKIPAVRNTDPIPGD